MMMLNLHTLAGMAHGILLQTASYELNWIVETYKKQVVQEARSQLLPVLLAAEPLSPLADFCFSNSRGISCPVIPEGKDLRV